MVCSCVRGVRVLVRGDMFLEPECLFSKPWCVRGEIVHKSLRVDFVPDLRIGKKGQIFRVLNLIRCLQQGLP
jgi:hypothetical protein